MYTIAGYDDDGPGPNPTSVIVGGSFSGAGYVSASNIAKWNPASGWTNLGSGVESPVFALAVYDEDGDGPSLPALYAAGSFFSAGGTKSNSIAKWDGTAWTPLDSGLTNGGSCCATVNALCVFDDDGPGPHRPALYAAGHFSQAGDVSVGNIAKWDGASWSAVGSLQSSGGQYEVNALAVYDPDGSGPAPASLYAAGNFRVADGSLADRIARWDGALWHPLGSGLTSSLGSASAKTLVVHDDDGAGPHLPALYVGGSFTRAGGIAVTRLAKWDGSFWSAVGAGGMDNTVYAFASFDTDGSGSGYPELYAGGNFNLAGGAPADYVARRQGDRWVSVGGGMDRQVRALATFDQDGAGAIPAQLYAAGDFTLAGGVSASRVARWNGGAWADVGGGVDSWVYALLNYDQDGLGPIPPVLIAGGDFTVPANRIAGWNGTAWSPVGGPMNSWVYALAAFDEDGPGPGLTSLYAGGNFTTANGVAADHIARWDGTAWTPLGSGTNGPVYALAVFDPDGIGPEPAALYVAGQFTLAGGQGVDGFAKWDGSSWSALGSPLNGGSFLSLAVFDEDGAGGNPPRLFGGGIFSGSVAYLGRYLPEFNAWVNFGGTNGAVYSLGVFDPDAEGPNPTALYIGGQFTTAAGNSSSRVAAWVGISEADTDGDGVPDCNDGCPNDPNKTAPGVCGCGVSDADSDGDGVLDCLDGCPNDPNKVAPGVCGCGNPDVDSDGDGVLNCLDGCPNDPAKTAPGICGCGVADTDTDGDGTADCNDGCPNDPSKIAPGQCGCGVPDTDTDGDGTANCNDGCPNDPNKIAPGQCGCGVPDTDTDGDGTADCIDGCPSDPLLTAPTACGCGLAARYSCSILCDPSALVAPAILGFANDGGSRDDNCAGGLAFRLYAGRTDISGLGKVWRILQDCSQQQFGASLARPESLLIDNRNVWPNSCGAANLIIVGGQDTMPASHIYFVKPVNGTICEEYVDGSLGHIGQMALLSTGELLLGAADGDSVSKLTGGIVSAFYTAAGQSLRAVCADQSDTVYVTGAGDGILRRLSAGGVVLNAALATGLQGAVSQAIAPPGAFRGNLYVACGSPANRLVEVNLMTGATSTLLTDLPVHGIAFDPDGYLHLSVPTANHVVRIGPTLAGDMNGSGTVDLADFDGFVNALVRTPDAPLPILAADMNADGCADGRDIGPFVAALLGP